MPDDLSSIAKNDPPGHNDTKNNSNLPGRIEMKNIFNLPGHNETEIINSPGHNETKTNSPLQRRGKREKANCIRDNNFKLLNAVAKGHNNVVQELLQGEGVDVNARNEKGCTPLYLASALGNTKVVKMLLEHNAKINMAWRGVTPLHVACQEGRTAVIKLLLQHKASTNVVTEEQFTPLHVACEGGHSPAVNLLLQHNASPDATTNSGATPLLYAAKYGNDECVRLLLAAGADQTIRTMFGKAIKYARNATVKAMILDAGDADVRRINYLVKALGVKCTSSS